MNNKGFTLVELMVSVALVSIVLVFMFNLLGDIKRESSISNDNIDDIIDRSTITRIIQNEWIEKKLTRVATCNETGTIMCYAFTFKDNSTKRLLVKEKEIEYDNERWILEDGEYNADGATYCSYKKDTGKNYLLKIVIPVIDHKEDNRIHDIELVKMGTDDLVLEGLNPC